MLAPFVFGLLLAGAAPQTGCSSAASQSAMDVCADQSYRKADADLNAAYKAAVARLGTDVQKIRLLRTAESSWIAYRDAECTFAASGSIGGSIYPMVVSGCLERLTRERTKTLQTYLHCAEGDTGCPVPPR